MSQEHETTIIETQWRDDSRWRGIERGYPIVAKNSGSDSGAGGNGEGMTQVIFECVLLTQRAGGANDAGALNDRQGFDFAPPSLGLAGIDRI